MKRRILNALSAIIFLGAAGILSAQANLPSETWIRVLPAPEKSFRNDQYRYELWSFRKPQGQGIPTLHVDIYPEEQVRTRMMLGTAVLLTEDVSSLRYKYRFDQGEKAEALRLPNADGFPISTFLKVSGLVPALGSSEFIFERLAVEPGAIRTASINGFVYENLNDIMVTLAKATPSVAVAKRFVQLFFLQVLTHEARIKDFGSNAMINMKLRVPGLAGSWLDLAFESRGFFGLDNSGVLFTLNRSSDFPGLVMGGKLYAGSIQNEGTMTISFEVPGGDILLGSVDCSKIKLAGGVAASGIYLVKTSAMAAGDKAFEIPYTVVGD